MLFSPPAVYKSRNDVGQKPHVHGDAFSVRFERLREGRSGARTGRSERTPVPAPPSHVVGGCKPRRYRCRVTERPPTLYIFPHAGGSAEYYVPFAKAFSSDIKRVAVRYPGRAGTHDLGSFTSIADLADKVCRMLPPPDASDTVAFFGHSMGGLLAFEVARRFEEAGNPIAALFVSACAAPGRVGYEHIPESDRGLLDAVSQMTGVNPEFLENEEFAANILPTLRGLKAISKYDCPPDATVSCPIFAFLGEDDEVATPEKMSHWSERTTSEFSLRAFPGHHFYLTDHIPELVSDIEGKFSAYSRG
jgi:surfactin synthase thioesterase subunit